jgi:hypothetical protein
MAHSAPAISFGTAGVARWPTETVEGLLSTLEKHNVKELDTALLYVRLLHAGNQASC